MGQLQVTAHFLTYQLWSMVKIHLVAFCTNFIINQNHIWWHFIYQLFWRRLLYADPIILLVEWMCDSIRLSIHCSIHRLLN